MSGVSLRTQKLRSCFVAGAVVIVIALFIWATPKILMGSIEAHIISLESQTTLTPTETTIYGNLQSARSWWEIMQVSTSEPMATVVLIIGLLIISYGFIVRFL